MAFADWSATPDSNALTLGVNIGEGCAPSVVNNAMRKLMADVRAAIDPALEAFLSSTTLDQARTALGVSETEPEGLVPAGAIFPFGGSAAPTGYLECDGTAVSRSTYSGLFTALGSTYGSGDGSTTFNLPDLRGEFVRGWDHGRGIDIGRVRGTAQDDELEAHTHTFPVKSNDTNGGTLADGTTDTTTTGTVTTSSTGGTETRPRNIALMHIIKT